MNNKEKAINAIATIGRPRSNADLLNEDELSAISDICDRGGFISDAVAVVWGECMDRIAASKATVDIEEPSEECEIK